MLLMVECMWLLVDGRLIAVRCRRPMTSPSASPEHCVYLEDMAAAVAGPFGPSTKFEVTHVLEKLQTQHAGPCSFIHKTQNMDSEHKAVKEQPLSGNSDQHFINITFQLRGL